MSEVKCPYCGIKLTGASVIAAVEAGDPNAMCDDCYVARLKERVNNDPVLKVADEEGANIIFLDRNDGEL